MKRYIADTNFYLRFLMRDVGAQVDEVEKWLRRAKKKKVSIFFSDEVILEMSYVMRSFYKVPKELIVERLIALVNTSYLDVENRELWAEALETYKELNVALIDVLLVVKAIEMGVEVLTFDEGLRRLVD